MRRKISISLILLALGSGSLWAAPRSLSQMKAVAANALAAQGQRTLLPERQAEVQELRRLDACSVIGIAGGAFAVVAADDAVPGLLAVSTEALPTTGNAEFEWWLHAANAALLQMRQQGVAMKAVRPADQGFPEAVEPLVTTRWGQSAPFNNLCPLGSDGSRCLTGCVATSTAQLLNYHQLPLRGQGSSTIYYPVDDATGTPVYAHFGATWYDWANMRDRYRDEDYTAEEAEAVALLMLHAGVSADMAYGTDSEGGSGARSTTACQNLQRYFGVAEATYLSREDFTEEQWMQRVFEQLAQYGPIVYNGNDQRGGHSFIVDGYNSDGLVHVNWGYEGSGDGYYNIALLNPSFSLGGYSTSQDMMIVRVDQEADRITTLDLSDMPLTDGLLPSKACYGYPYLTEVTLPAGITAWGDGALGACPSLRTVHLPEAEGRTFVIVDDVLLCNADTTELIAVLPMATGTVRLPATVTAIHANALDGCIGIDTLDLPAALTTIGQEALKDCAGLSQLRCRAKTPPTLSGYNTFQGIWTSDCHLSIPSGTKAAYARRAQWKDFTEIDEFGTTVKANNAVRKQGEENPEFGYTMSGEWVAGTPYLYTDATIDSPPGVYTIFVLPGTIAAPDVEYVNGRLIVEETSAIQHPSPITHHPTPNTQHPASTAVYSLEGVLLMRHLRSVDDLQPGIYIVGGRKVVVGR